MQRSEASASEKGGRRVLRHALRCRSRDELASMRRSMLSLLVIALVIFYIPIAEVALQPFACTAGNDGVWRMNTPPAAAIVCDIDAPDGRWRRLQ